MTTRRSFLLTLTWLLTAIHGQTQDSCPEETFYYRLVEENTPPGTVILTLTLLGSGDDVTLTATPNSHFRFEPDNLTVVVDREIDYDVTVSGLEVEVMEITCTNNAGQATVLEINFDISNVNDNVPEFSQDNYTLPPVGEMTALDSVISTSIAARDRDAGSLVYYRLLDGQFSDYFSLQSPTATDLVLKKPLDFESVPELHISIMAMDGRAAGDDVFNSTCDVSIPVKDEDDQNPVFNASVYRGTVASDAVLDSVVEVTPQIYAYDLDLTLKAAISYSFHGSVYHSTNGRQDVTESPGDDEDVLEISPSTGEVRLRRRPGSDQIYLLLQATQTDSPARYGVALLTVKVLGNNVHAPVFSKPSYDVMVTEAFPTSHVVAMVAATDADLGSNVTFELSDQSGTFSINAVTGDLTLLKPLSHASSGLYDLKVTASDGDLSTSANLTVRVSPVPGVNLPPSVLNPPSDLNVTLNRRVTGDVLVTLQVEDLDDVVVTYELLTYTQEFAVSGQGQVTVRDADRLTLQSYPLTLVVKDARQQTPVVVKAYFPNDGRTAAVAMADSDSLVPVVMGVVAAVFFIISLLLLVYILRRRGQDKERLDKVQRPHPARGAKPLSFKPKQATVGKKGGGRVNIDFRDQFGDGETTVQENPLNAKNTYFNFGQSDLEDSGAYGDSDDIIQVETSVVPFGSHGDDNNNDDDNIFSISDNESFRAADKSAIASIYANGSLSTFRDSESGGSEVSLNTSPTDSADSKCGLVAPLARGRGPEGRGWSSDSGNTDLDTSTDPGKPPAPQKQELTVYF